MTECTVPVSACVGVPTVPCHKRVPAPELNTGDIVEIPGHSDYPGEVVDGFPAVVREVTPAADGHIVHVHYMEPSFDYHRHPVAAGAEIYRIAAAR